MTTTDIRKAIEEIGYTITSSWRKDYGDGRVLSEYKLLKSAKSRKPLAFVQVGYYTANQEIIGLSVTLASNMSNSIDCNTVQELETCLKQFDEIQIKKNLIFLLTIMFLNEIFKAIKENKFVAKRFCKSSFWGNYFTLITYKVLKSTKHKRPLAFVEIYHNVNKDVLNLSITYAKTKEHICCKTIQDFESNLMKIK